MNVQLKNGSLQITIPVNGKTLDELPESKSGKTRIFASTGGNQPTTVSVDGRPVVVGLNAYVKI